MVRRAQNLPADKVATPEEQAERDFYHSNADSIYSPGINVGREGFYDPQAGADKHPLKRPERAATPLLATDPGQPKGIGANLVSREANSVLDRSEKPVVRSTSGRKVADATKKETARN